MATLIAVYNFIGDVRCCGAKCYDAKGPDCNCICGGANHGVGETIAREDSKYISDDELAAEWTGLVGSGGLRVFREPQQLVLFPDCRKD